jgi:hypothetical protein
MEFTFSKRARTLSIGLMLIGLLGRRSDTFP